MKDPLDILKKPVLPIAVKTTRIRELHAEGKLPPTPAGTTLAPAVKLPQEEPPVPETRKSITGLVRFDPLQGFKPAAGSQDVRKTSMLRARLRMFH